MDSLVVGATVGTVVGASLGARVGADDGVGAPVEPVSAVTDNMLSLQQRTLYDLSN